MRDAIYQQIHSHSPPQLPHHYGPSVHLSACPLSLYELARLSAETTQQPLLTRLVRRLYSRLLDQVVAAFWPTGEQEVRTRMAAHNDRGIWRGQTSHPGQSVVVVDIARAGTVPAQTVYDRLTDMFPPQHIRQDHLVMARQVDGQNQVVGAQIQAQKTDGGAAGATVLIPDPMGATGNTLSVATDLYKKHPTGAPARIIALHLIVTPEYLRHMAALHPDVQIWALRLDRGLSSDAILATVPGQHPDEERGLNERHYIIPGAGGMGELLNNTHG